MKTLIDSDLTLHIVKGLLISKSFNTNDIKGAIYLANSKYTNRSNILNYNNNKIWVKTLVEKNGKTLDNYRHMRPCDFKTTIKRLIKKELSIYDKGSTFKLDCKGHKTVEGIYYNAVFTFDIPLFNQRVYANMLKLEKIDKDK